jgi:hypothetical protein
MTQNEKIKDHYRKAYSAEGRLEKMFGTSIKYISQMNCDNASISNWSKRFISEIKRVMIKNGAINSYDFDLKDMHDYVSNELIDFTHDGMSELGKMFYDFDSEFISNYHEFIKWLSNDVLDFDFYFQATPTIRFNCSGASLKTPKGNLFPFPKYHTDLEYGHPPQEINLWWSFTDNDQTGFEVANLENSKKWYESYDFDLDKFTKISCSNSSEFHDYGSSISQEVKSNEILLFDARCIHSAIERNDNTTRVSMDIRINPVEDFTWPTIDGNPVYTGKGRVRAEFKPGGRYGYYPKSALGIEYSE